MGASLPQVMKEARPVFCNPFAEGGSVRTSRLAAQCHRGEGSGGSTTFDVSQSVLVPNGEGRYPERISHRGNLPFVARLNLTCNALPGPKMKKKGKERHAAKAEADDKDSRPAPVALTKDPRRPEREPPGNLRQRAEWFRRRTGGTEEK
jgi:hypothetical protein